MEDVEEGSLGSAVSRQLFALWGRMRAHLDEVAASLDLTPMQSRALHHLGAPCPMGDVADRLHCDPSNVTGIVDRLEERGLVERRPDPEDRRRRMLVTTREGAEVREQMHRRIIEGHPIIQRLDLAEQQQLHDLLARALAED